MVMLFAYDYYIRFAQIRYHLFKGRGVFVIQNEVVALRSTEGT